MNAKTIAVLGAGSWGTALAILLANNGHSVRLWGHDHHHIEKLIQERQNQAFLPGIVFPKSLQAYTDLSATLSQAELIVIAIPSSAFRTVLNDIKPFLNSTSAIIWGTKGLDAVTNNFLYATATEILGTNIPKAILAGPSFAKEVAQGLPTAVTIASPDIMYAQTLAKVFHAHFFRPYITDDMIGAEVGGIVKNILAIAVGISDGIGFGANARAALITRGLTEIVRLGLNLGGRQETFYGLTGIGDLVLTATDNQSRNRRFGLALGQGVAIADAIKQIGQVVEGAQNAKQIYQLAKQQNVEMPICEQVYKVLHENLSARDAVKHLMQRQLKPEE